MSKDFLIIEDDELSRVTLVTKLSNYGSVLEAKDLKSALECAKDFNGKIAFVDLDLDSPLAGLELIAPLKKAGAYVVVLSGREDDDSVLSAYERGCNDFIAKPFSPMALSLVLQKFNIGQKSSELEKFFKENFLTMDQDLILQISKLKETLYANRPILIQGETGTGKSLLAKLIHDFFLEKKGPFVHLNVSEIPENLIESELFGHKKGAFTGATNDKLGKFKLADGGVLFLDEIGTLSKTMQNKLLRVIEEKSFYPVGSDQLESSDFRLLSATCEPLQSYITEGTFREDLYFRLSGQLITIKSLRERSLDIEKLIQHFLKAGKRRVVFEKTTKDALFSHDWPGNVRELENLIRLLQTKSEGIIKLEDLPFTAKASKAKQIVMESQPDVDLVKEVGLKAYIESIEDQVVKSIYELNEKKVRKTLDDLKISSNAFYRVMKRVDDQTKEITS
ncbi:MAG: sigma-54-dependent transcriptional regulator [Bacteriovoracaceae bacterium]